MKKWNENIDEVIRQLKVEPTDDIVQQTKELWKALEHHNMVMAQYAGVLPLVGRIIYNKIHVGIIEYNGSNLISGVIVISPRNVKEIAY